MIHKLVNPSGRPVILITLLLISILGMAMSCSRDDNNSLRDNECYVAKRITIGCPSFAFLQILDAKVGAKWTYNDIIYDNVITISNYVDSIKNDTLYLTIDKSKDWQSCQIQRACLNVITLTRPAGIPYCVKTISSIKCSKSNAN